MTDQLILLPSKASFLLRKSVSLALLGIFFFSTYGFANWYASTLLNVPSIVFAWEEFIPFVPWTIIPYWSIDLFYALSVLICINYRELNTHVFRLLTAQVICIACFLLFPLKFSVDRPESSGLFGVLFDVLMGFDKPFNQAPSLHIVLLGILWVFYTRRTSGLLHVIVHVWSLLIAVSVLTTWQHHFIDIPTGILVAAFCLWLWPDGQESPIRTARLSKDRHRLILAAYYLIGSMVLIATSFYFKSYLLWLLWPACSLLMVSLAYACLGGSAFQKQKNGKMPIASVVLFAPYLLFAWLNSRLWTWKKPEPSLVYLTNNQQKTIQLYLGRISGYRELQAFDGLLDMCAELSVRLPQDYAYGLNPILDLTIPDIQQLRQGVNQLDQIIRTITMKEMANGRILICCALGYSRSACMLAAWLIWHGYAQSAQHANDVIRQAKPAIVLKPAHLAQLDALIALKERVYQG